MKRGALDALADNLAKIMEERKHSEAKVASLKGPTQKTVNNIVNRRHKPTFATLDKLARALGFEPYQLLAPVKDSGFFTLLRAYNETDDRGREILLLNAGLVTGKLGREGRERSNADSS